MLTLRPPTPDDCRLMWNWANAARPYSLDTRYIPYPEHNQWFKEKLNDQSCLFYVATIEDTPVGQIRLQKIQGEYVVSVSVDGAYRGKGYGTEMIKQATTKVHGTFCAYVKASNSASVSAFTKAGFVHVKSIDDDILFLRRYDET